MENEPKKENIIPGEEDIKERIEGFNKEIVSLLAKYELGIAAGAFITQDGRVGANPIIVSARKKAETKEQEEAVPEKITNPEA